MKLKPEEMERIALNVISTLKKKNLITFKSPEDKVKARMVEIINTNMEEEARIDLEAEEILKKFQREIDSGQVDYRKMFLKVKNQLAKERKFII